MRFKAIKVNNYLAIVGVKGIDILRIFIYAVVEVHQGVNPYAFEILL